MVTPILSRVLSAFAALAILFGAPAASPFGHDGSTAIHAAVSIEGGPALCVAQAIRVALEPRSHSRAPLPSCATTGVNACVHQADGSRAHANDPLGRPTTDAATRGYDATAPPTSS